MRVIWSKMARRVHKYGGNLTDERCNVDQIVGEDRVIDDVPADVGAWAKDAGLKLCRRCFP